MPRINRLQSDLLQTDWSWASDDSGSWGWNTVKTAAAAESARRLISIDQTLRIILSRLDALGSDGIHDLIRLETTRARVHARKRRQAAAAKRKRTMAAKRRTT